MRKLIAFMILVILGGLAFGGDRDRHEADPHRGAEYGESYLRREIDLILAEDSARKIGGYTVGELEGLADRLSVAGQKDAYVRQARKLSFLAPGLWQLKNGSAVGGTLYMLVDFAVNAGSAIGAYFLLPADLRFDQLNYFTSPFADIRQRWEAHSFTDLLPSFAVMAGRSLLDMGLRFFSSRNAGKLARTNIDGGSLSFEARALLLPLGGGLGIGVGVHY